MKRRSRFSGVLLLLPLATILPAATFGAEDQAALQRAAAALPVSAFFALPEVRQPAVSPDGSRIAFLYPHEGRMALGVYERSTGNARMILRSPDDNIASFGWKGNDHLVFLADYHGNESYFIGTCDANGQRVRRIAESHGVFGGSWSEIEITDWLPADLDHLVIDGWIGGDPGPRVVKLHVPTSRRETLYAPPLDDERAYYWGYVVDGRSEVRFARMTRNKEVSLLYRPDNRSKFTVLHRESLTGSGPKWSAITASSDGRQIHVVSREHADRGELRTFDPDSRTLGPALFAPPAGEITALFWDHRQTKLLGLRYDDDRPRQVWFDSEEGAWREKVAASFTGMEISTVSRSLDDSVRLVSVWSDREPGVYFVFDRKAGALAQFKRPFPKIDFRLMRPMEPISFVARDGLQVHGYLTRPFAAEGGPGPMVVLVHGGPFGARDYWGFDPEVQFLASRGYAVLQVNFRGSGGYGTEFVLKGRRQWGRGTQDDITDGVKWAIAQGIADPGRIAIYGASFGGYAALIGAALTPDLYRCAVNYVGVADLEITGRPRSADAWMTPDDFDYRSEWIGETKAYRDATNPVLLVERIRIPTLHAYGRNDPRVNIDQWHRLEAQLKKFKKPYTAFVLKHAGHGFNAEADSLAFHETLARFLAANLGAR